MKVKVLIAEDERLAREELAFKFLQKDDLILCPSAENGKQLIDLYKQYDPQIIFLDVEMPILSGIQAAQQITKENHDMKKDNPLFVFITAYEEYAVDAFGVEAVDYLLKPYGNDRLQVTLTRLRKKLSEPIVPIQHSKLLIEDGEKLVVIQPEDIYYASRVDRFIEIYTKEECIQTRMTLQELEEKVVGFPFLRPHRSYLVNLEYVQEIVPWFNGAYNLILKNKKDIKIPVSRSAAKVLFDRLKGVETL